MNYTVIREFTDTRDDGHLYRVGDQFPRPAATPSPQRIAELASNGNRLGTALIGIAEETVTEDNPAPKEQPAVQDVRKSSRRRKHNT